MPCKLRFINKLTMLAIFSLLLLLILSYGIESNYFELMFWGDFEDYEREFLKPSVVNWDMFFFVSNAYTILFYPIFAALPVLNLRLETDTIMKFSYPRLENYKKSIVKSVLIYSVIGGLVVLSGFLLFTIYGVMIGLEESINSFGVLDFLQPYLMSDYPVIGAVLHGVLVFFPLGVTYGLFASCVAISNLKKYMIVLLPLGYYSICGVLFTSLWNITKMDFLLSLSPLNTPLAISKFGHGYVQSLICLLPIIVSCIIYMCWRLRKNASKIGY